MRTAVSAHYGLTQIAIVLASIEAYELARKVMTPNWPVAVRHAHDVVSMERFAHIHWEAPIQQAFLGVPDLVRGLNIFYFVGHFLFTGVFFVWLYHRSKPAYRTFRNGFLAATAIALLIHWRFPTAPPRLADVGLVDTLRHFSGIDIGSPASNSFSNPVAAVPSLHAGFALGVGIGLVLYARPSFWKVDRRHLPDRRRADDDHHGQPLHPRRGRRDGRARPRLRGRRRALRARRC